MKTIIALLISTIVDMAYATDWHENYAKGRLRGEQDAVLNWFVVSGSLEDGMLPSFWGECLKRNPKLKDERLKLELRLLICHSWNYLNRRILVHQGYRTAEEQNALYKKGRSKLDGYKKKSFHQSGNAVDFVFCKDKACRKLVWGGTGREREQLAYTSGQLEGYSSFVFYLYDGLADFDKLEVRVGADWDCDHSALDSKFVDLFHYEISHPEHLPSECREEYKRRGGVYL